MYSRLRSVIVVVLALIASLVGLAACAKYPVVVKAATSAPTAATPAPTPAR
jgi:hypothetical protein